MNFGGTIADSIDYGRTEVNSAIKSLATDVNEGLNFTSTVGVDREISENLAKDISDNYLYKIDSLKDDKSDLGSILSKLRELSDVISSRNNMQVVLDSGTLVGEVIEDIDIGLGILKRRKERGE